MSARAFRDKIAPHCVSAEARGKFVRITDSILESFDECFRPRFKGRVEDWARKEVILTSQESQEFAGAYDPDLNPLPTILFDFATCGDFDECYVMKSSQSGFTLVCLILIVFWVVNYRRNILYAIDSISEVRRISNERLQPMLERCAAAAAQISEDPDDTTTLTISLKDQVIYMGGAGSVGAQANKSIGLAIVDETDTYKMSETRTESHPALLIADRLKRVLTDSFYVALSKPDQWEHFINQNYLTGTRHKCYVPCPHCTAKAGELSGFQEITWEKIRFAHCKDDTGGWDTERIARETYMQCEFCDPDDATHKGRIYEKQKPWMVANRQWRRTNFGQDKWKPKPRRASIHVSDLYSTFPKASWGTLANEWIEAMSDSDKIDNFRRGRLGLPVRKKTVEITESHLQAMLGNYQRGHCPVRPDIVTMASDRQSDVYKWSKWAWHLERNEGWLVDWGQTISEMDLIRHANEPVIVDNWGDTPEAARRDPVVLTGFIDEGHKTFTIRGFCLSTEFTVGDQTFLRFYPAKGAASTGAELMNEQTFFTEDKRPVPVIVFKDAAIKTLLYEEAIEQRSQLIEKRNRGEPTTAPLLHFPAATDPSWMIELAQEKRIRIIKNHNFEFVWAEPKGPNDHGDATKMNLLAFLKAKPMLAALKRLKEQGLL